jgi:hypothetical protein
MTTIAWDGKSLAGDRRISFGGITDASITKIVRREDGALCGTSGNSALGAAFKRWFLAGEESDRPSLEKGSEQTTAFIIRPCGQLVIHDHVGWYEAEAKTYAIGSGWELALGAMAMGATAEEAVRIAARLDGSTGSEIDVLHLQPLALVADVA